MVSFRLAALKILKESKEPLHYEEITKRALDQNLIETSGATPEATMNSQLSVDIKVKGVKSSFVRTKPGYFALNSALSQEEERQTEQEELTQEEAHEALSQEEISTQYIGKAGEHLVVSELLFRGYNASIMSVDEGLDIVATKEEHLFNVQVKTSNENKFDKYLSDIRISSFEKYNRNNTYYIFVLKGNQTNFLILPYPEIQRNIDQKNILVINKNTRYRVNMAMNGGKIYLGKKNNDVSYYLNNWGLIK